MENKKKTTQPKTTKVARANIATKPLKTSTKTTKAKTTVATKNTKKPTVTTATKKKSTTTKKPVASKTKTSTATKVQHKKTVVQKQQVQKQSVLFATSECHPFAATGGLAFVTSSLPKSLAKHNPHLDVRVVMPLYQDISREWKNKMQFVTHFTVTLAWRSIYCGVFSYTENNVQYYFIDNEAYFKRPNLYGHFDDGERFAFFSQAVVSMLPHLNYFPNIIHCNDWQTALIPAYLKQSNNAKLQQIKTIFTIHNIEYQGVFGKENAQDLFGIKESFTPQFLHNKDLNLTKGAIEFCDVVSTVSPTYAQEIKEPLASFGLNSVIVANQHKLIGIVNGIDYTSYDPQKDPNVFYAYHQKDFSNKAKNKTQLQSNFGLQVDETVPMLTFIGRLVKTKGVDAVLHIIQDVLNNSNAQFVVLGRGDSCYEQAFLNLQRQFPGRVHASVGIFSNELTRQINAAADVFLMPSINEPCGLSQMIACRYGAIPLVREVGGLKDTILDFGNPAGGNGYTFNQYNEQDFKFSIFRILKDFENKELWNKQTQIAMQQDFSWEKSIKDYLKLYETLF